MLSNLRILRLYLILLQPFKLLSGFQIKVKGLISKGDLKCKDLAALLGFSDHEGNQWKAVRTKMLSEGGEQAGCCCKTSYVELNLNPGLGGEKAQGAVNKGYEQPVLTWNSK